MRILIAPDSYKGSVSAEKVGNIMKRAILADAADAMVDVVPMADGGEGTIDALLYTLAGRKERLVVTGPTGKPIEVYYGVLDETKTAVIEIATIVGFDLVAKTERDPLHLTTFGIGECILHALDQGFRKFIICLGGSATNDGGLGMLQALGASFQNQAGEAVDAYPHTLSSIVSVDYASLDKRMEEVEMTVASDVKNILCGEDGATYIFGPQKGLLASQLSAVDSLIYDFAQKVEKHLAQSYQTLPGAGAAGGLGFAMLTVGAQIVSGAQLIADHVQLEAKIAQADLVITGEGRTDYQTLEGKLPLVVAKMAKEKGLPTILISGALVDDLTPFYDVFDSMHAIANGPLTVAESMKKIEQLLTDKTRNIMRLVRI